MGKGSTFTLTVPSTMANGLKTSNKDSVNNNGWMALNI